MVRGELETMPMKETSDDLLLELDALLASSSLRVTFSQWCSSGTLGRDRCLCWRCRERRGEEWSEETERIAERESKEEKRKLEESTRALLR